MSAALSRLLVLLVGLSAITCANSSDGSGSRATNSSQPLAPPKETAPPPPPEGTPAVVFTSADGAQARVWVELAVKPPELQRGLMYRHNMAWDRGMLFIFDREEQQSFWMKNTLIPLDMIFVRKDMTVLGVVHDAEPRTLISRRVDGPSQFVIEVNAGWAKENGITGGTRVAFEGVTLPDAIAGDTP